MALLISVCNSFRTFTHASSSGGRLFGIPSGIIYLGQKLGVLLNHA